MCHRHRPWALLLGIIPILFIGCAFGPHWMATGRVTLVLGPDGKAKTILPVVSVDSYLISFSGPATHGPVSTTQSNPTIELEVGTWTISVEGLDSEGKTIVAGSKSGVVVSAGATTTAAITLVAQTTGSGGIDVTVSWPTLIPAIDGCVVTLDGSAVPESTVTFTSGGATARYVEAKDSGNYRLCINLKSGTLLRASVQEAVQVYQNLTSSATIELTSADFTYPPEAPSALVVAEGSSTLDLSWEDNSHVETAYVVERSMVETGPFEEVAGSLSANTESYSDSGVSLGTMYWYRVKARNDLGDSGYAGPTSAKVQAPVPGGAGTLTLSGATASSIEVSWQKATDNVSAQSTLRYKVVRSTSDNVGTAALAELNGTPVMDWTTDVSTASATGLSAGTLYYFNVLAKDEKDNTDAYVSGSQSTIDGTGYLELTITVTTPQNETISFSQVDNFTVAVGATLTLAIGQSFDSYSWTLDGEAVAGQTTENVTIDCGTLAPGVHHLAAFVMKGGLLYSATVKFRVEN
jgi:hypothetical protein